MSPAEHRSSAEATSEQGCNNRLCGDLQYRRNASLNVVAPDRLSQQIRQLSRVRSDLDIAQDGAGPLDMANKFIVGLRRSIRWYVHSQAAGGHGDIVRDFGPAQATSPFLVQAVDLQQRQQHQRSRAHLRLSQQHLLPLQAQAEQARAARAPSSVSRQLST